MKSVAPNIFVNNINQTIEFYKQLGFSVTITVPEEGDLIFAMMTCGNVVFMFQTFESLGAELPEISRQNGGSLLLYVQIADIRNYFEQIKEKVKVLKGLEKTFYGATEFSIEDNNGYVLTFAEDEV
ncbi:MAG: VOC family protein [Bacteroidota bacterium]